MTILGIIFVVLGVFFLVYGVLGTALVSYQRSRLDLEPYEALGISLFGLIMLALGIFILVYY